MVSITCAALVGCGADSTPPLRVFAAASLTDVVQALVQTSETTIAPSFGASSVLARQIRDGAPADLFLSAAPEWMDVLNRAGALDGEPIVLGRNRLVAIAPRGCGLASAGLTDPRSLADHLGGDARLAIAVAGVPAGEYARAALAHFGLLERLQPRLVGLRDVRAVLNAVAAREVTAGFVYATEVRIAEVETLFTFDPASHPPIEYQAAVLAGAADPAGARAWLAALQGERAVAILRGAGFEIPAGPAP